MMRNDGLAADARRPNDAFQAARSVNDVRSVMVMTPVAASPIPAVVMSAIAMPAAMAVTMAMAATDLDHRFILTGGRRRRCDAEACRSRRGQCDRCDQCRRRGQY